MALPLGTKLGPYEILEPIGKGGMGEVYRARDPRVGRDVAIKISGERFSERFEREVRAVAALNHPNVCQLYDVGLNYLVLELIEGPTLQETMQAGPLAIAEALPLARQIADALDAAHEKGIVHRDLKPGNIKVRPDGTVKVLDFGLAKVIEPGAAANPPDVSHSPTLTMGATVAGMILGTAAYMSPEQAKGWPIDKRADIWAFGGVLYEMLSGKKAFPGDDVSEILAAVLRADLDWGALPSATPRPVVALLHRCLEKDPRRRLRDIGDARWEMEEQPPAGSAPGGRRWLPWAAAAVLAMATGAGWLRTGAPPVSPAPFSLTIVPPSGATLDPVGNIGSAPEISPDGRAVLYRGGRGGLYVRRLDSLEPVLVPGSQDATNTPFWSSDSTSVAFPTRRSWIKVRLPDGAPQPFATLPGGARGGTWNEQGLMLIASNLTLYMLSASGGEPTPVEVAGQSQPGQVDPQFLPGSDDFLFLVKRPGLDEPEVYIATLRNGKGMNPVLLMKNDTAVRYTPAGGGRILFVREDKLYSQKLDRTARKLEGTPELVAAGVASGPGRNVASADFSVSRTGVVVWRPGKAALSEVTTFDRQGRVVGTTGPASANFSIALSPDESRLLASGDRPEALETGQPGRLSLTGDWNWALWSPDGLGLVGSRAGRIGERPMAGSDPVREVGTLTGPADAGETLRDISPDGNEILALQSAGGSISSIRLDGQNRSRKILVRTGEQLANPHFSPDGRWIVYSAIAVESGSSSNTDIFTRAGIFVQPFPGPGLRKQIARGGLFPEWRKDGSEILYVTEDSVWSVGVGQQGAGLRFGDPQKLFSGFRRPPGLINPARPMAVSRDGSRIYLVQGTEQPDTNMIHVRSGWTPSTQ